MFENYLEKLLNGENDFPAYYVGGTLCLDDVGLFSLVMLNISGKGFVKMGNYSRNFTLSHRELKLVSKLYLKHKTPDHSFYEQAKEIVYGGNKHEMPQTPRV